MGYRIDQHIGSGGFGTVDEVTLVMDDGTELTTGLAKKSLLAKHLSDAEAVARFKREVRILDSLDHPNILPITDRNVSDVPPWFVMPKAQTNLAARLRAGTADTAWVNRTFDAILGAIEYAHRLGVLHRDLKPENVLIIGGEPMINDFGLGRRIDTDSQSLTETNVGWGTYFYAAPEQMRDFKRVGPPADVYALGKILWEMLSGQPQPAGSPDLNEIPDEYRSFVERCTQHDPDRRFETAHDARTAFKLLFGSPEGTTLAVKTFDELIKDWEAAPAGDESESGIVRQIAASLLSQRTDERLFYEVLPRLDSDLVARIKSEQPDQWDVILRAYDNHVDGNLPFDYCDTLANFYRRLFEDVTTTVEQKSLILARLIELGPLHNRWYVGTVLGEILESITEHQVASKAGDLLRANQWRLTWNAEQMGKLSVLPEIQSALDEADVA